ncbi:hypothetical protein DL93DRAFT_2172883 [Clavulina sp. PMI_390]|nr:hypothetical protein DL93DRAFT_2172883 [Clavulina sp. PMI_390]
MPPGLVQNNGESWIDLDGGYGLQPALLRMSNLKRSAVNLPVEILGQIFTTACYGKSKEEIDYWGQPRGHRRVRSAIGGTCSYWRDVSLQVAQLWSVIYIKHSNAQDFPNRPLLDIELERSGSFLLDLHVNASDLDASSGFPQLIMDLGHKCRSMNLVLIFTGSGIGHRSALDVITQLPALEKLAWRYPNPTPFSPASIEGLPKISFPCLAEMEIEGPPPAIFLQHLAFPSLQVLHLRMYQPRAPHGFPSPQSVQCLTSLQSISLFDFHTSLETNPASMDAFLDAVCTLPRLEDIYSTDTIGSEWVFRLKNAPALKRVWMRPEGDAEGVPDF